MFAVGTAGAVFSAALPILALALPLALTGIVVTLALFFTVKAVSYAYQALKYSAGKIKDGAVYPIGNTMREGTSAVLKTAGRKLNDLGENMGNLDSILYSPLSKNEGVMHLEEEKMKKFSSVREIFFEEVFQDKISNKSALIKKVLSGIGSQIAKKAYSVDPKQSLDNSRLINQLEEQADFISKLDAKKLENLLAEGYYYPQFYKIFSEHHDEIKGIIQECKKEHIRVSTLERLNSAAKRSRNKSTPAQLISSPPEGASFFLQTL